MQIVVGTVIGQAIRGSTETSVPVVPPTVLNTSVIFDGTTGVSEQSARTIWIDRSGTYSARADTLRPHDGTTVDLNGHGMTAMVTSAPVDAVTLPDAPGGQTGEGFTNTGLSRLSDGRWVLGNHGLGTTTSDLSSRDAGVTILSPDMSALSAHYSVGDYVTGDTSVQGVVALPDDSIWFAAKQRNTLVHITSDGVLLSTATMSFQPNGIAYNTLTQRLLVGRDGNTVVVVNPASGAEESTFTLPVSTPDQFYFDEPRNLLWYSNGVNGADGSLNAYDLTDGSSYHPVPLGGAEAIEGLYIDTSNDRLYAGNDAFFHNGTSGGNAVLSYPAPLTFGRQFSLFVQGRFTPLSSTGVIFGIGEGDIPDIAALYARPTQGMMRLETPNFRVEFTGLPSTTASAYWIDVDLDANTATVYVDGTAWQTLTNTLTGTRPSLILGDLHFGMTSEGSRTLNAQLSAVGLSHDPAEREAVLAGLP